MDSTLVSFAAQAEEFQRGTDTPRDFLERSIARYEAEGAGLNAFVTVSLDLARRSADRATERWRGGQQLSPVDGMPIGIKDVLDSYGELTSLGLPPVVRRDPGFDSAAVWALRRAGAAVFGKTKTTEFAMTFPADTVNPHDRTRTPGGSSSGSAAAVGAGILPSALGTQGIASIIRPASFCGAYAFKPTFGGINRGGANDAMSQSVIGAIAASLQDTWATASAICSRAGGDAGHRPAVMGDALAASARPARVAVVETPGWPAATEAAKAQLDAAREVFARNGVDVIDRTRDNRVDGLERALAESLPKGRAITGYEASWMISAVSDQYPLAVSGMSKQRGDAGLDLTYDDYAALMDWRRGLQRSFADLMRDVDCLIALSAPGAAPIGLSSTGDASFGVISSVLGSPAISLPLFEDEGLPLGLQLVGAAGRDDDLFGWARWVDDTYAGR